jgi:hypothetical protein
MTPDVATFPYLRQGNIQRKGSLPKHVREYMLQLLKHAFMSEQHLSSPMNAIAGWLARPQQFTLDQLDAFSGRTFTSRDVQRLRAELLSTETYLVKSAKRLERERHAKAAGTTDILVTPPMSATRFSPQAVAYSIRDFFTPTCWPSTGTPSSTSDTATELDRDEHTQGSISTATGFTQLSQQSLRTADNGNEDSTQTQDTALNAPESQEDTQTEPSCTQGSNVPLASIYSQRTLPPRRNPIRPGRPPTGNTDHLVLLSDLVSCGRLPDDHQIPLNTTPILHKPGDMDDIWVTTSHHCPEGGLACFVKLKGPYITSPGTLIARYFGTDTNVEGNKTRQSRKDHYQEAMQSWAQSDYVLAHPRAQYAVDGAKNCGPAYINDGFDKVNVYFSYNNDLRCMEIRTIGPMLPGKYELLVNYDQPHRPSTYWTPDRRSRLPPETLALLEATYPARAHARLRSPAPKRPPNTLHIYSRAPAT